MTLTSPFCGGATITVVQSKGFSASHAIAALHSISCKIASIRIAHSLELLCSMLCTRNHRFRFKLVVKIYARKNRHSCGEIFRIGSSWFPEATWLHVWGRRSDGDCYGCFDLAGGTDLPGSHCARVLPVLPFLYLVFVFAKGMQKVLSARAC